jgi:hypothetical protein
LLLILPIEIGGHNYACLEVEVGGLFRQQPYVALENGK